MSLDGFGGAAMLGSMPVGHSHSALSLFCHLRFVVKTNSSARCRVCNRCRTARCRIYFGLRASEICTLLSLPYPSPHPITTVLWLDFGFNIYIYIRPDNTAVTTNTSTLPDPQPPRPLSLSPHMDFIQPSLSMLDNDGCHHGDRNLLR
jgi:hypothetical protein